MLRYTLGTFLSARSLWNNPFAALRFFLQHSLRPANALSLTCFTYRGQRFYSRPTDWYGVREVLLHNEYAFVPTLLVGRKAPVVLDLGANIGTFALYALAHIPGVKVHSLEASRRTFAVLHKNFEANRTSTWKVHWGALWKEDGNIPFEDREYSTGSRVATGGTSAAMVPAISLATFLAACGPGRIDLVKMDIEGAEEAVLLGHESLLHRVDHLVIEIHCHLCNHDCVVSALRSVYSNIYCIKGKLGSKRLLLATRQMLPFQQYP